MNTILTYIGLIVAAIAAFGTAWLSAKRSGAKAERAKQDKARIESMTEAQKIDEAVVGNSVDENRKEAAKWTR